MYQLYRTNKWLFCLDPFLYGSLTSSKYKSWKLFFRVTWSLQKAKQNNKLLYLKYLLQNQFKLKPVKDMNSKNNTWSNCVRKLRRQWRWCHKYLFILISSRDIPSYAFMLVKLFWNNNNIFWISKTSPKNVQLYWSRCEMSWI